MDLFDQMRIFKAVNQAGTFSQASKVLGQSTSSISRKMACLEDQFGIQLFLRGSRRLTLTKAGELFLERAERIIEDLEQAKIFLKSYQTEATGHLCIAALSEFGHRFLAPIIPNFIKAYPDIDLELRLDERTADLLNEGIDLAFRIGKLESADLAARILVPNQMTAIASPRYLESQGTPASVEDLHNHQCMTYNAAITLHTWLFENETEARRFKFTPKIKVNSGDLLLQWTKADLGICLLPYWYVHQDLQRGHVTRVLPQYRVAYPELDNHPLHIVYPFTRTLPPKTRAFIDFVLEHLELH